MLAAKLLIGMKSCITAKVSSILICRNTPADYPLLYFVAMKDPDTMEADACRLMARECYDLAREAPEPDVRRRLLDLAVKWHELAQMIEIDRASGSRLH
jgi:hypothetical protein